jgi:hypothetical protein
MGHPGKVVAIVEGECPHWFLVMCSRCEYQEGAPFGEEQARDMAFLHILERHPELLPRVYA